MEITIPGPEYNEFNDNLTRYSLLEELLSEIVFYYNLGTKISDKVLISNGRNLGAIS